MVAVEEDMVAAVMAVAEATVTMDTEGESVCIQLMGLY